MRRQHRSDGILRRCEHAAESVAGRFEDVAAVLGDGRLHNRIVPPHGVLHRDAVALPARGAALDIREGKRYLTAPSIMVAFCLPPDAAVIPLLIRRHRLYYFLTERCDGLVSPGYLYDFPLAVMYEAPDVIGSR